MDNEVHSTEHVFTPFCPHCNRATRVSFQTLGDGPDKKFLRVVRCAPHGCRKTFNVEIHTNPPSVTVVR